MREFLHLLLIWVWARYFVYSGAQRRLMQIVKARIKERSKQNQENHPAQQGDVT